MLRAGPDDYARFIAQRRRDAVLPSLLGLSLAVGILVFDYRLMIFAFLVLVPPLIAVVDAVKSLQAVRGRTSCAARVIDGVFEVDANTRLPLSLLMARSLPDALIVVVKFKDGKFAAAHVIPAPRAAQRMVLDGLSVNRVPVTEENRPIIAISILLCGVVATYGLAIVGAGLAMAAFGWTAYSLYRLEFHWQAVAFAVGAVATLTLRSLMLFLAAWVAGKVDQPRES